MGLYPADCISCGKPFMWFSGNPVQICADCNRPPGEPDDSVVIRIEPTVFDHEVIYYVPVFQHNFNHKGEFESPSFTYNMELATQDEQMAYSFDPDYVLELRGHFKAATKPFTVGGDKK